MARVDDDPLDGLIGLVDDPAGASDGAAEHDHYLYGAPKSSPGAPPDPVTPLMGELLAWIAARPRTYEEAIDAWRSNCPREPVWDDAVIAGLVRVERSQVRLTARGRAALD